MKRQRGAALGLAGLGAVLGACSASSADFRDDAEEFLRSDEVFSTYGVDFTDPACDEPASTETGSTITCSAEGDDATYAFTLRITGRNEMVLESLGPVNTAQE